MRWLYQVLGWIRNFLQTLGVLFGMVPRVSRFPPWAYHAVHYGFVILVTLLLAWISPWIIAPARVPFSSWFVQQFYLAIQFVLLYAFVRLLLIGVRLFFARDVSEFEDIDRAWYAGLETLAREGYDLQWLPIFLISGLDAEQETNFFKGVHFQWKISGPPADQRPAALSFYVCDEAVFICLTRVGALAAQLQAAPSARPSAAGGSPAPQLPIGQQATLKPGAVQAALTVTQPAPQDPRSTPGKTLDPQALAAARTVLKPAAMGGAGQTILPDEMATLTADQPGPQRPVGQKLSKEELAHHRDRMAYFCRLLSAERGVYCPLNGLLQVIPLRWTDSHRFEDQYAAAADDQATLQDGTHMHFPVVLVQSGLNSVVGVEEFVQRGMALDSRFRDSRAGSRYPAGLPLDEKTAGWIIDRSLSWFRVWVYAAFAKELSNLQNRGLYQFLCNLTQRRDRLCRELLLIFDKLPHPVRLGGCYFVAAGAEATRQAFAHDVVQRLIEEQNDVAWTEEWRAKDRRHQILSACVSILVIGFLAADIWLGWQIWQVAARVTAE